MRILLAIGSLLIVFCISSGAVQAKDYIIFETGSKKGLKDDSGTIIIPAQYDDIGWSKGQFEVFNGTIGYRENKKWGLISVENEIITPPKYTQLYYGNKQYLISGVRDSSSGSDLLGVIDLKGNTTIDNRYTVIQLVGVRAIVAKKVGAVYKYGLIDFKGKTIIPIEFKYITHLGSLKYSAISNKGSTSIYNDSGEKIIDIQLDSISSYNGNYIRIYDGYKIGLMNEKGEILIEPKYADIKHTSDGYASVRKINTWYSLSANNQNLGEISADQLALFNQSIYKASTDKTFWLTDLEGIKTSDSYDSIGDLTDGLAPVNNSGRWGVINKYGKQKIPTKHDSLRVQPNGLVLVKNKDYWSVYDSFNIRKTYNKYTEIGKSKQGLLPVRKNNHWGFIDRSGEELIHCVYSQVGDFNYSLVDVKFHGEVGVINKEGEWIVLPKKIDSLKVINRDYFISYSGKLKRLIDFMDEETIYFTENRLEVKDGYLLEHTSNDGLWKIDFSGRIIGGNTRSRDEYEEVRAPSEGFYAIKKGGSYGFIDNQNRLRIANRYQDVGDFHNGLAAFKLLNKWGFLDKREQIIIQPSYEKVSRFYGSHAIAYSHDGAGLIDVNGNRVSSFSFDSLLHQQDGKYLVFKNGKTGLLSENGELMINPKYDYLKETKIGYTIISSGGKFGLVDEDGVNTIPMIYDNIIFDEVNNIFLAQKKSSYQKVGLQ